MTSADVIDSEIVVVTDRVYCHNTGIYHMKRFQTTACAVIQTENVAPAWYNSRGLESVRNQAYHWSFESSTPQKVR